jgi:hypothetical protein
MSYKTVGKYWWLVHRVSPQADYWMAKGRATIATIKRMEKKVLYGEIISQRYDTEEEYRDKVETMKAEGFRVIED